MPIWDVNAAGTASEIGCGAWDQNATGTAYPLQHMWDTNTSGTASKIWDAEKYLWEPNNVHSELGGLTNIRYCNGQRLPDPYTAYEEYPDYIRVGAVRHSGYGEPASVIGKASKISTAGYTTLKAEVLSYQYGAPFLARMGLCASYPTAYIPITGFYVHAPYVNAVSESTWTIISLDISAYQGSYYPAFWVVGGSVLSGEVEHTWYFYVKRWWLE